MLGAGARLDADVIVNATGLELKLLAGLEPVVDGRRVTTSQALPYRGIMLADVPNLAMVFGYTNASWTLTKGSAKRRVVISRLGRVRIER